MCVCGGVSQIQGVLFEGGGISRLIFEFSCFPVQTLNLHPSVQKHCSLPRRRFHCQRFRRFHCQRFLLTSVILHAASMEVEFTPCLVLGFQGFSWGPGPAALSHVAMIGREGNQGTSDALIVQLRHSIRHASHALFPLRLPPDPRIHLIHRSTRLGDVFDVCDSTWKVVQWQRIP